MAQTPTTPAAVANRAKYYRGASKKEAERALDAARLPFKSGEPMSKDWEVIEYSIGDGASSMSEREIGRWIRETVWWRDRQGVNLTDTEDNAKGYGEFVLAIDCTGDVAHFNEHHHLARNPDECVVVAVKKRKRTGEWTEWYSPEEAKRSFFR